MQAPSKQKQRWDELSELLDRTRYAGPAGLESFELKRLCRLYRQVTIDLSQARANRADPEIVRFLNALAARAHGAVYRQRSANLWDGLAFLATGFPRGVRKLYRPILVASAAFILSTILTLVAVLWQPSLAKSLFDENTIEFENVRLDKQKGGTYKGNFTFELSKSPFVAVAIIANNCRVAIFIFALGALLCVPGLLLLIYQGRMLGALTGVIGLAGYAGDFYNIILTHGVLELTAFCIAAGAGLHVGWSWIVPGELSRGRAFREAARDAAGVLLGTLAMLVVAGVIEAFISPHCENPIRWSVAAGSGILFALYVWLLGGPVGRVGTEKEQLSRDDADVRR